MMENTFNELVIREQNIDGVYGTTMQLEENENISLNVLVDEPNNDSMKHHPRNIVSTKVEEASRKPPRPPPPKRRDVYTSQPVNDTTLANSLDEMFDGPDGAAFHSRLPPNRMTEQEKACFPDLLDRSVYGIKNFLTIRNRILQKWIENPKVQLTYDFLFKEWEPASHRYARLIKRIHAYLDRHGFINFGMIRRFIPLKEKKTVRVIVLGAGISGLAVGQHLQHLGFDVTVLEARDRVGGRIATFRRNNSMADLGVQEIFGLWGNPMTILSKQIGMDMVPLKRYCPLYDSYGKQISNCKDEVIETEFNRLLQAVHKVKEVHETLEEPRKPLSLGQALDWLIKMQEKAVLAENIQHAKDIEAIQLKLNDSLRKIQEQKASIAEKLDHYNKMKINHVNEETPSDNTTARDMNDNLEILNLNSDAYESARGAPASTNQPEEENFEMKVELMQLNRDVNKLNELNLEVEYLEEKLEQLEANPPAQIYLSSKDRAILNWNMASLEYILGTSLDNVSSNFWNHGRKYDFPGNNTSVKNGCSCIPIAMTENLDIRLHTAAKLVKYQGDRVHVVSESTKFNNNYEVVQGDLVVCTLPLGVLKTAVASPPLLLKQNNFSFEPQLPEWKRKAINNLGYGVVNKVVLCFEKIFWDPTNNLFGCVEPAGNGRGELFLFTSIAFVPVLVGLFSGKAAIQMESIADEIIVERCITMLKTIFGDSMVPNPKESVVTRWFADPFARGTYSYITPEASADDYDVMAKPVFPRGKEYVEDLKVKPRLFFAGEHTSRCYPATVHGAYLSGLREAGRIADFYLGYLDGTPDNLNYNPFEVTVTNSKAESSFTQEDLPYQGLKSSDEPFIIFENDSSRDTDQLDLQTDDNNSSDKFEDIDDYFGPIDRKVAALQQEVLEPKKVVKSVSVKKRESNLVNVRHEQEGDVVALRNRQKVLRNRTVVLLNNKAASDEAAKIKNKKL